MGLCVEEMVVAEVDTDAVSNVPHSSDGELGRRVLIDLFSIAELVDGRNLAGLVNR